MSTNSEMIVVVSKIVGSKVGSVVVKKMVGSEVVWVVGFEVV